jgi:two-component system cell cycle sensor histidine kinase/response regulator CckA
MSLRPWLWRVAIVVGTGLIVWYSLVPDGSLATVLYDAVGGAAAASILATAVGLPRGRRGTAWFLAAGLGSEVVGDLVYGAYPTLFGRVAPFPSLADVFYLIGYASLVCAAATFVRHTRARGAVVDFLDAAVVTLACGLPLYVLVVEPTVATAGSSHGVVVATAYPAMDLLLLALTAHALLAGKVQQRAQGLIAVSFALMLVADVVYAHEELSASYVSDRWLDAGWLFAYVLAAAGALHPTFARVAPRSSPAQLMVRKSWMMVGVLLLFPLSLLAQKKLLGKIEVYDSAIAFTVLAVVLSARFSLTLRDHARSQRALVEAERQLRTLVERAADAISILDEEWRVVYQSPAAARILGRPLAEMDGVGVLDLVHPDDRATTRSALASLAADGGRSLPIQLRVLRPDGSTRAIAGSAQNLLADPAVRGYVVNWRDVTDERAAQAQLRIQEERLRRAEKLEDLGRLTGGIAHDFNNLLMAINGHAELGRGAIQLADAHKHLEQIGSVGEQGARLTRQLLSLGTDPSRALEPSAVDVRQVANGMVAMLRSLLPATIELRTATTGVAPVFTRIDRGQLEQILLNLVLNARDAMPDGGAVTLQVGAGAWPDDATGNGPSGPCAILSVRDTGSGMSAEVQRHLFDPFFTTKTAGHGTGLGLATVDAVARRAGGSISVSSAVGAGSTFHVYLPAVDHPEASPSAPVRVVARPVGLTVLLVEDDPCVRAVTAEIVASLGYSVTEAEDGTVALRLLARSRPDLILTDAVMPHMGGLELAVEVESRGIDVPVVLVSGQIPGLIEPGVLPIAAVLCKPYTIDALRTCIADAIARRVEPQLEGTRAAR